MADLIGRLSELRCRYNCFDENERDAYHTLSEAIKALSDVPGTNVGDTIRRQWLMECVNEGWIKFDTEKDKNKFIHLVRDIAPSADVQPVVRCKNCKHSTEWYGDKRRCFLWHEEGIDVFEDGFCNYWERKGGEQNDKK